jgi:hypothetical protein
MNVIRVWKVKIWEAFSLGKDENCIACHKSLWRGCNTCRQITHNHNHWCRETLFVLLALQKRQDNPFGFLDTNVFMCIIDFTIGQQWYHSTCTIRRLWCSHAMHTHCCRYGPRRCSQCNCDIIGHYTVQNNQDWRARVLYVSF